MLKLQPLRAFVNERLTEVATEIFEAVEKTLLDYQREEIERFKRLVLTQPEIRLHILDSKQFSVPGPYKTNKANELKELKEEQLEELESDSATEFTVVRCPSENLVCHPEHLSELSNKNQTDGDSLPRKMVQLISTDPNEVSEPTSRYEPLSFLNSDSLAAPSSEVEGKTLMPEVRPLQSQTVATNTAQSALDFTDSTKTSETKQKVSFDILSGEKKPFKCTACSKRFSCVRAAQKHVQIHIDGLPHRCKECGKHFSKPSELALHRISHTGEKPFKCKLCRKGFLYKCHLVEHVRIHTGEKPYSCDVCGKNTTTKSSLVVHMRTHTGEKPHKCQICGLDFRQNAGLRRHMVKHTGERLLHCEVCGEGFDYRTTLRHHMTSHKETEKQLTEANSILDSSESNGPKPKMPFEVLAGEEKPYKCSSCSVCFSSIVNLQRHLSKHNDDLSHQCKECGKFFGQQSELVVHMVKHSVEKPYKCTVCSKGFLRNHHLVEHKRTHLSEKPYQCKICSGTYATKSGLVLHMRTHTGEKPFGCTICGRCFSQSSGLRAHMLTHTC